LFNEADLDAALAAFDQLTNPASGDPRHEQISET
jgi:hypothetical protein